LKISTIEEWVHKVCLILCVCNSNLEAGDSGPTPGSPPPPPNRVKFSNISACTSNFLFIFGLDILWIILCWILLQYYSVQAQSMIAKGWEHRDYSWYGKCRVQRGNKAIMFDNNSSCQMWREMQGAKGKNVIIFNNNGLHQSLFFHKFVLF
jgi:hypothetical protein